MRGALTPATHARPRGPVRLLRPAFAHAWPTSKVIWNDPGRPAWPGELVASAADEAGCTRRPGMQAAAQAGRLEPENAAKPSVDVAHYGGREVRGPGIQIGLVQGDQSGHVND